ncbi:MAG: hypothetical protein ACE5JG_04215 [Planctomycetota bacterium]
MPGRPKKGQVRSRWPRSASKAAARAAAVDGRAGWIVSRTSSNQTVPDMERKSPTSARAARAGAIAWTARSTQSRSPSRIALGCSPRRDPSAAEKMSSALALRYWFASRRMPRQRAATSSRTRSPGRTGTTWWTRRQTATSPSPDKRSDALPARPTVRSTAADDCAVPSRRAPTMVRQPGGSVPGCSNEGLTRTGSCAAAAAGSSARVARARRRTTGDLVMTRAIAWQAAGPV